MAQEGTLNVLPKLRISYLSHFAHRSKSDFAVQIYERLAQKDLNTVHFVKQTHIEYAIVMYLILQSVEFVPINNAQVSNYGN